MAGANGLRKYQLVDRDDYIVNLKTRDVPAHLSTVDATITGAVVALTPSQLVSDLLFTPATNNALGFGAATAADIIAALPADLLASIGQPGATPSVRAQWTIAIENTDPLFAKTLNFPAGFTPATLAVPVSSYNEYTFEITSTSPAAIRLLQTVSSAPPGASGVTSFTGMQGTARSGAVVAINDDYNLTSITNDLVAGVRVPPATFPTSNDAIEFMQMYTPPPVAQVSNAAAALLGGVANTWTLQTVGAAPANQAIRDFTPPVTGVACFTFPGNGITDNFPVAVGFANNVLQISALVRTDALASNPDEEIGIRVRQMPANLTIISSVAPNNGTAASQEVSVSGTFIVQPGQTYVVDTLNGTGDLALNANTIFLSLVHLGNA